MIRPALAPARPSRAHAHSFARGLAGLDTRDPLSGLDAWMKRALEAEAEAARAMEGGR